MSKRDKIFISYSHKDKDIVDTIARRLAIEFGRDNIFYDLWSIQPGESVIGKMNEGLEGYATFFFLVSSNSLNSKMAELEWQTALNLAVNNNLKFVAVKIDNCVMPAILEDRMYIDLYNEGIDNVISKMKLICRSELIYNPLEDVQNLIAIAKRKDENTIQITLKALHYSEDNLNLYFSCANSRDDISVCYNVSDYFTIQGFNQIIVNNIVTNSPSVSLQRTLKPNFPFIFEVYFSRTNEYKSVNLFALENNVSGLFAQIPLYDEKGNIVDTFVK